ncbi:MAG: hypothetical protein V5B78_13510, partial [Desulfohalobiaceae bacterium]
MNRFSVCACLLSAMLFLLPSFALATETEQLENRIDKLEQKLEALQPSQQEKESKQANPLESMSDRLTY